MSLEWISYCENNPTSIEKKRVQSFHLCYQLMSLPSHLASDCSVLKTVLLPSPINSSHSYACSIVKFPISLVGEFHILALLLSFWCTFFCGCIAFALLEVESLAATPRESFQEDTISHKNSTKRTASLFYYQQCQHSSL